MKNFLLSLVGIAFLAGSVYFFLEQPAPPSVTGLMEVRIGEGVVYAEVADTPGRRQLGLSGRESLEEGRGLLFIFDDVGRHGIWMKDMLFSIDIVWLDEDKRVVWVEKSVSPDTYPQVFTPDMPSKYVLELPAGSMDEYNAQIGDIFIFKT